MTFPAVHCKALPVLSLPLLGQACHTSQSTLHLYGGMEETIIYTTPAVCLAEEGQHLLLGGPLFLEPSLGIFHASSAGDAWEGVEGGEDRRWVGAGTCHPFIAPGGGGDRHLHLPPAPGNIQTTLKRHGGELTGFTHTPLSTLCTPTSLVVAVGWASMRLHCPLTGLG